MPEKTCATTTTSGDGFKTFYFTSLVNLLNKNVAPTPAVRRKNVSQYRRPSTKSSEIKYQADLTPKISLPVDPHFLTRRKDWSRKSLAQSSLRQQSYERDVKLYERDLAKALNHLQNSKSHHDQALRHMQTRQLEIQKERDHQKLLVQAQCLYNNSPILESKRICVACARRPKSAKASIHASVDGVLRPQANRKRFQRMTFSAYESRAFPPVPSVKRDSRYEMETQLRGRFVPKIVCFDDVRPAFSLHNNSRVSTPASVQLFDSELIPDSERVTAL